jgi:lipoyl(octanoyl) transferase
MRPCRWRQAGLVPYDQALGLQKELVRRRRAGLVPDTLLLLEHPPVITLGKMAKSEHLLSPGGPVPVVPTDRGGDVTFHGPGQLVGYPILDLGELRRDVKWYLERLEEVLIRTVGRYGLAASAPPGLTGAWVGEAKIGAIGVRTERWVTSHGFALNANVELAYFDLIIPCGLVGKRVTSLAKELGRAVDLGELGGAVVEVFGEVFGRDMVHDPEASDQRSPPIGSAGDVPLPPADPRAR